MIEGNISKLIKNKLSSVKWIEQDHILKESFTWDHLISDIQGWLKWNENQPIGGASCYRRLWWCCARIRLALDMPVDTCELLPNKRVAKYCIWQPSAGAHWRDWTVVCGTGLLNGRHACQCRLAIYSMLAFTPREGHLIKPGTFHWLVVLNPSSERLVVTNLYKHSFGNALLPNNPFLFEANLPPRDLLMLVLWW